LEALLSLLDHLLFLLMTLSSASEDDTIFALKRRIALRERQQSEALKRKNRFARAPAKRSFRRYNVFCIKM
jgi:hypothetical protein